MFTNVWYVAGFSNDLTNEPIKTRMMGADLVLFREPDGTARCISNICPHRGSSLADGCLYKDGTLACPFHGYQFNGHGECTLVPSRRDHEVQVVVPGMKSDWMSVRNALSRQKLAMVAGNMMIEELKIGGMTPAMLIFRGRCVFCPP